MLKELRFVPRMEVKSNLQETMQTIDALLQHVPSGAVRNYARFLFNLGKAAEAHPALLTCLQQGAYRQQLEALFEAAAVNRGLYGNPFAVSQMTSAQVSLSIY